MLTNRLRKTARTFALLAAAASPFFQRDWWQLRSIEQPIIASPWQG